VAIESGGLLIIILASKLVMQECYEPWLKSFYKYKQFHSLSIPLTEFWNRRKEIEELLQNVDRANYWKGLPRQISVT